MTEERSATVKRTVTKEMTAKSVGSGSLEVLATPIMAAMMEEASCKALEGLLKEGETTVGISLNLQHTAATPVSMAVEVTSTLQKVEGRKYTFEIVAKDEKEEIGRSTHERFLVFSEKFQSKADGKRS